MFYNEYDCSPCDFCCMPESECPCAMKYGTEVESDRNKFNYYAELHGGIKILPPDILE